MLISVPAAGPRSSVSAKADAASGVADPVEGRSGVGGGLAETRTDEKKQRRHNSCSTVGRLARRLRWSRARFVVHPPAQGLFNPGKTKASLDLKE